MLLIVSTFCVLLASVGGSPNAKFVEELVKNNVFGSVSSGILEDARLDVPQLVRKYKYPLEEHHVITPDGYILTLHRIPHGRDSNTQSGNKPAVFVMHGVLCSSADWVLTGPDVGLGSLRPDFSEKIASAHMLAPVVFNTGNGSPLMDTVAPIVAAVVSWATENGFGEIFPKSDFFADIGRRYCRDGVPTQSLCTMVLFMLGGWSESQHNATLLPVKLAHTPAGSGLRQFAHLTQNMASKKFRRYDYGPIQNILRYGQTQPPEYNLLNIKNPVFLNYSDGDTRTNEIDINLLYDSLDTTKELIRVPDGNFSHIDFMWGKNAKTVLYDRVISEIRKIESSRK
ncbi:unnamed protein product [Pieris brassicae]|uniref:Partial AB-hydrolase lipase domain-containing protein n=1 Tax=Pieris brassicae TaxID=7116 RepID=A0A9P0TE50_PIEBR|nr:unnamed protein product [Pieris brassicae]